MKLNIPILLGTTRVQNKSHFAAQFIFDIVSQHENIETQIVDPATLNLPGDGNDPEGKDPRYSKITEEADAFIIVTPEYNHSFPGSLKRMLDSELSNYIHKAVAVCGVSSGSWGGVRAVTHLMPVLRELGLAPIFNDVYFTKSYDRFDEETGEMIMDDKERYVKGVEAMITELVWMAETLKDGRDNRPNKHHPDVDD